MARLIAVLLALSIPSLILIYLSFAPYTKIEESFTIQATHDVLTFGVPIGNASLHLAANYDHIIYPELHPVPRTFVAPLLLAAASRPFVSLVQGIDKQILVRAVLGLYNAFCMLVFRNAVAQAFGSLTANWYIIFQALEFHVVYYSSRTLPNFIPFGLSTVALASILRSSVTSTKAPARRVDPALVILTILGIVFRSELAIFLGAHTLYLFLRGRISIPTIIFSGTIGLAAGLASTVPLDSYLWRRYPLWPELTSFLFNVYEGRSVDWGVSPWHYYFSSGIPKLLFNPLLPILFIPIAVATPALRSSALDLLAPNLLFIAIYSMQPHKEWRFVVYSIPALTAVAAQGASWVWLRRSKTVLYSLLSLALVASCALSFLGSLLFLSISTLNYPGATALNILHALVDGTQPSINVHMDVLTAQTGTTLFLQLPGIPSEIATEEGTKWTTAWHYDKTDDKTGDGIILLRPEFWERFDYALAERPEKCIGAWDILATIDGYAGIKIIKPHENPETAQLGESVDEELGLSPLSARGLSWGQGPWFLFKQRTWRSWKSISIFMRKRITRGWWVNVKMQPMIHILKRVPMEDIMEEVVKDDIQK